MKTALVGFPLQYTVSVTRCHTFVPWLTLLEKVRALHTLLCTTVAGSWIFNLTALMRRGDGSISRRVWATGSCSDRCLEQLHRAPSRTSTRPGGFRGILFLRLIKMGFRIVKWILKVVFIYQHNPAFCSMEVKTRIFVWGEWWQLCFLVLLLWFP